MPSICRVSAPFYRSSSRTSDPRLFFAASFLVLAVQRIPGSWENRADDVTHTDVGLESEGIFMCEFRLTKRLCL